MTPKSVRPSRLLTRAHECRCQTCPPDRVCAWACVQGTSVPDIIVGAVLEQSRSWALENAEAGSEAAHEALWDMFNT